MKKFNKLVENILNEDSININRIVDKVLDKINIGDFSKDPSVKYEIEHGIEDGIRDFVDKKIRKKLKFNVKVRLNRGLDISINPEDNFTTKYFKDNNMG